MSSTAQTVLSFMGFYSDIPHKPWDYNNKPMCDCMICNLNKICLLSTKKKRLAFNNSLNGRLILGVYFIDNHEFFLDVGQ